MNEPLQTSGKIVIRHWRDFSDLLQEACNLSDDKSFPVGVAEFHYTGGGTVRLVSTLDFIGGVKRGQLNFSQQPGNDTGKSSGL